MYSELIVSLLALSHVLSDFYFQNEQIAIGKEKSFRILLKHVFHFFACSTLLTVCFFSWSLILYIFILSVLHLILDYGKIRMSKRFSQHSKLFYFMSDQLLHIIAILALYPYISDVALNQLSSTIISYLEGSYPLLENLQYSSLVYMILATAFILFLANGGTIIIKLFLELPSYLSVKSAIAKSSLSTNFKPSAVREAAAVGSDKASSKAGQVDPSYGTEDELYKYGEVIGILERLTIFLLIISGHYEGIALVIAAKSIARFKQFEKHNFSDYYLVGTLASTLAAIIGGELFLFIFNKII